MRALAKLARDGMRRHPSAHRALRAVWSPPKAIHQKLLFDGPMSVDVSPGASFVMESHGEYIETDLFWRGFGKGWEGNSLKAWAALSRSVETVIDVGANTGVYSLLTKTVSPAARVIALEPAARTFAKLVRNIELNGYDITAEPIAVSDENGTATFYDWPDEHQYTASLEAEAGGTVRTQVKVERFDDLVARHQLPRVDLVKIDVELHEPAVFRGMADTLRKWRPALMVEILNDEIERAVRESISGLGYRACKVPLHDSPEPFTDERNFIIAQPEVFERVLSRVNVECSGG